MSKMPKNVHVLGDPHLGRKFKTGVPLHRIGEREEFQFHQFKMDLTNFKKGAKFHVNMGDLFDKYIITPEIVLWTAKIYTTAAFENKDVEYIILRGNHDVSRDANRASSFDIFRALVAMVPNITVVNDDVYEVAGYGFVPYSPFVPTSNLVEKLSDNLTAVFGHWDIQDWGGENVIPTKLMASKGITLAISGHDHLKRDLKRDGVEILVTGSMQPFTHAEDNTGKFYQTVTLAELEDLDTENLNIRVLLKEGETLPIDIDCLSLTAKRITDEDEKIEVDTSEFETLDLKQLLANSLNGLTIKDELMEAFENVE